MNIGIAKIGQKLIFDRSSHDAIRSSTNGNVSVWSFFNLLIHENKNIKFYIYNYDILPAKNCFDFYEISPDKLDICLFFVGINDDSNLINIINTYNLKYILFCDDLRCLNSLNKNQNLKTLPLKIISQDNRKYIFHNKIYHLKYLPIETSQCYLENINKCQKKTNFMTILANYTTTYPRLDIIQSLINNTNYKVYGRLNKNKKYSSNFKGEVDYKAAQHYLASSYFTLIVPVEKNVVTTKYIEALLNNTIPLFYKDYNTRILKIPRRLIIRTKKDIDKFTADVNNHNFNFNLYLKKLQKKLIMPFFDGHKLNKLIFKEIRRKLK